MDFGFIELAERCNKSSKCFTTGGKDCKFMFIPNSEFSTGVIMAKLRPFRVAEKVDKDVAKMSHPKRRLTDSTITFEG
jgi:hypothetical protein